MIFVPRETWGHPHPDDPGGNFLGVQRLPFVVEHHTPGQMPTTYAQAVTEVRKIYVGHIAQGWQDIGYTDLVWDEYVFEGRGFGWTGAHAPGANSTSIGVAFILDGRFRAPTDREQQTIRELCDAAITYGYLMPSFDSTGHRDWVSTTCPGDLPYAHVDDVEHPLGPPPNPQPQPTGDDDVPEFDLRPGGPFQWGTNAAPIGGVNYSDYGGAAALDHPDVHVGDTIVICPTAPPELTGGRFIVVNLLYPSGKQTVPREVPWGKTARITAEEAGQVTVLVSANGYNRARAIVGRP